MRQNVTCLALSSAKDIAPTRKLTLKRPFKKQSSADTSYSDPFENEEVATRDVSPAVVGSSPGAGRHWTISTLKQRFSIKKSNSFHVPMRETQDDFATTRRRDRSITTSTFYDDENMAVTKSVSEPAEFIPLDLKGKNMNELLLLLKSVSVCMVEPHYNDHFGTGECLVYLKLLLPGRYSAKIQHEIVFFFQHKFFSPKNICIYYAKK